MNFSLKNRFLIPVLVLIIIGMGISTAISYYKSKAAIQDTINGGVQQLMASTANVTSSWVRDRKLDIQSLGQQKIFATALKDSFVAKSARKSANFQLQKFSKDYQYYENICVVDKAGNIVAAADEKTIGKFSIKERSYFKNAMDGKSSVSDVIKSKGTGKSVFVIAVPLQAKNEIIGVFFGVLDLSTFSKRFIDPVKLGESGYAYLYTDKGVVIAHPDKASIMKLNIADYDFGKEMIKKGEGQITYSFQGVEKLVAFNKVKGIGWSVAVSASTKDLLAPITNLSYVNISVACTVIIIATIIILLIVNSIVKPINLIVTGINEASTQVSSGSVQVSNSSQSLAEGASRQAASIEETSASMEEMSSMTKKNAENAGQADVLMKEANQVVETATSSMGQLTQSMEDISKASEETSKIIKTIDEIAFQTNLLALNAAVEAARAGEAGAGFAVVADEVRNLAMRAADAAKNTAQLIEGTVKKVNAGSTLVADTSEAFSKVAVSTGKVGELVSEISAASGEQSTGIEQVNSAISEMDKVVQQNASTSEESASASSQMNTQAEQLRDYIGDLAALISGEKDQTISKGKTQNFSDKKKALPSNVSAKEVRPDQLIPFNDDFKDF